jgi:hypothetical protein
MAIQIKDQPRKTYMGYDVTKYEGENMPYVPRERGIGPAEVLMFLVVVGLCYPIVHWVALTIARAFS